jgi:hypothetical protein
MRPVSGGAPSVRLREFRRQWCVDDHYVNVVLTNRGWALVEVTMASYPMGHFTRLIGVHRRLETALAGAERRNLALRSL